jgi:cytochrome c553
MQHRVRRGLQSDERAPIVEVAKKRDDAMRAKLAHIAAITRESDEMRAVAQALRDAQRNVAAPYQEHALHRASGAPKAPVKRGQAHTSRDPVQEPSMSKPTQSR